MADLMAAIFPAEEAHAGRMLGTKWKLRHVQNARLRSLQHCRHEPRQWSIDASPLSAALDRRRQRTALVAARSEEDANLFSTSPNQRRGRARQDRTSRRQISP